jgi:hypothetical protein
MQTRSRAWFLARVLLAGLDLLALGISWPG